MREVKKVNISAVIGARRIGGGGGGGKRCITKTKRGGSLSLICCGVG